MTNYIFNIPNFIKIMLYHQTSYKLYKFLLKNTKKIDSFIKC